MMAHRSGHIGRMSHYYYYTLQTKHNVHTNSKKKCGRGDATTRRAARPDATFKPYLKHIYGKFYVRLAIVFYRCARSLAR